MGGWPVDPTLWTLFAAEAAVYGHGVCRLRARGRSWSSRRTVSYLAGLLAVAAALVSPLATHDESFPVHVAQHVLLGMLAPLLLALSAPVTLALRTLPPSSRRTLVRVLRSAPAHVLAHPLTATALNANGLLALYLTPLYCETLRHPLLHDLVHVHMLAAGCLFTWVFVGLDPVPRWGGLPLRIALLLIALGSHAALAKLVYAGLGNLPASPGERHLGAQLMYYAGDAVELALLVTFFSHWYVAAGRRLDSARRRERAQAVRARNERALAVRATAPPST